MAKSAFTPTDYTVPNYYVLPELSPELRAEAVGVRDPYAEMYLHDPIALACLEIAHETRMDSGMKFGAVLRNRDGEIDGRGRNKIPDPREKAIIESHGIGVAYSIHAEQLAIADLLLRLELVGPDGLDPHIRKERREKRKHLERAEKLEALEGSELFVIGYSVTKATIGRLPVLVKPEFKCRVCPTTLWYFDIPVNVPTINGWQPLTPHEAMETGRKHKGWEGFSSGAVATVTAAALT